MPDKKDEALLRSKYSAYRKRMAVSPDTVLDTLSYEKWRKQKAEKERAKPGK